MTPRHVDPARVLDDVANALQTVVLLVEHLERITAATVRDVTAIRLGLDRATRALQKRRRP
jgi:hypothetical protein